MNRPFENFWFLKAGLYCIESSEIFVLVVLSLLFVGLRSYPSISIFALLQFITLRRPQFFNICTARSEMVLELKSFFNANHTTSFKSFKTFHTIEKFYT